MRSPVRSALRCAIGPLLAAAFAGPAAAEQGVVGCPEFKKGWAGALAKLGITRTAPSYGPPGRDGAEKVSGLPGLDVAITCRGGLLGHLELRSGGDVAAFDRAAAAVLVGLNPSLTPEAAVGASAALRAQTQDGAQAAIGGAGPYELTLSGPPARPGHELVLDMAEN